MESAQPPKEAYTRRQAELKARLVGLQRWLRVWVTLRLVDLILAVVLVYESCPPRQQSAVFPTLAVLAFLVFTVAIALLESRVRRCEALLDYYQRGLARLDGQPPEKATSGDRFLDPLHPYAADLDIFGPRSLFALLCQARTEIGQKTLAKFLTHPLSPDEILPRQAAIQELARKLPLREELWLAGGKVEAQEAALETWLASPTQPASLSRRLIMGLIGVTGLAMFVGFYDPAWFLTALFIVPAQRLITRSTKPLVESMTRHVFHRADDLRALGRMLATLRHEKFSSPLLEMRHAQVADAGNHIQRLVSLVDWLESRRNPIFGIIAWALILPEQLVLAIEAWRARHGAKAVRWLFAVGEIEALTSLATFSFEHPDYSFPTLLTAEAAPTLSAQSLGHPLIPAGVRVTNDVQLDQACRWLMVTGSNMSGKSTFLRTVGVNAVLAQAGAPVCATAMTLSPLSVGASMRAQDSLDEGVSRFFAEIKRLKTILAQTETPPTVLFLLDEILNGTNSHDRLEGAHAVIAKLLSRGALGIVTTHDLALVELVQKGQVPGANMHFQDTLVENRLLFDYKIRQGVTGRRNALDLMRLVGIEVDAPEFALLKTPN